VVPIVCSRVGGLRGAVDVGQHPASAEVVEEADLAGRPPHLTPTKHHPSASASVAPPNVSRTGQSSSTCQRPSPPSHQSPRYPLRLVIAAHNASSRSHAARVGSTPARATAAVRSGGASCAVFPARHATVPPRPSGRHPLPDSDDEARDGTSPSVSGSRFGRANSVAPVTAFRTTTRSRGRTWRLHARATAAGWTTSYPPLAVRTAVPPAEHRGGILPPSRPRVNAPRCAPTGRRGGTTPGHRLAPPPTAAALPVGDVPACRPVHRRLNLGTCRAVGLLSAHSTTC
jgi:hypothetical protein